MLFRSEEVTESLVFHAGTKAQVKSHIPIAIGTKVKSEQPEGQRDNSEVITSGGRVLAVTSFGRNISEAAAYSYRSISKISFEKMNYRKDIGKDLMAFEKGVATA